MPHSIPETRRKTTLTRILFGNPRHHTLENRIFNAVLVMVVFAGICASLLNWFSDNPARELVLTFTATVTASGFYIASRWYHADRYLNIPLFIIFLVLLCVAWMTNDGSNGSTLGYFFILFVAGKITISPPYDKWLLGISFAAVTALIIFEYLHPELVLPYLTASHMILDKIMSLMICLIVVTILIHLILKEFNLERDRSERLYRQTLKDKEALSQALTEIKMLRGILPVCSFCKKIRDENGEWRTMENYISSHSEAEFSHGCCTDCFQKHYGEYVKA